MEMCSRYVLGLLVVASVFWRKIAKRLRPRSQITRERGCNTLFAKRYHYISLVPSSSFPHWRASVSPAMSHPDNARHRIRSRSTRRRRHLLQANLLHLAAFSFPLSGRELFLAKWGSSSSWRGSTWKLWDGGVGGPHPHDGGWISWGRFPISMLHCFFPGRPLATLCRSGSWR